MVFPPPLLSPPEINSTVRAGEVLAEIEPVACRST
jgi:hypothetical protein